MADGATQRGICKWFNSAKGFGFITTESGEDVFVHQTDIHSRGFRSLAENEPVEFVLQKDSSGRNKAVQVTGPGGEHVKGEDRPPRRDDFGDDRGDRSGYGGRNFGGGGGGRRDFGDGGYGGGGYGGRDGGYGGGQGGGGYGGGGRQGGYGGGGNY